MENQKFLVFGRTGWIGGLLGDILTEQGKAWVFAESRLENLSDIISELDRVKPTHVLNAAGLTGRPNVDWCESHRHEVIQVNVCGTLNLAIACAAYKCHLTVYATGCIYSYDSSHSLGSGHGFTEKDLPNFIGSFYSRTKAMVEPLLNEFENVCILRVRMPLSSDLEHPRNFIKKISCYDRVVDVPNSMTVLEEMLPYSIELACRKRTGIYNFTNPGVISHNEILEMYRDYYKAEFKWNNFTVEEQALILAAPRSNNMLDTTKLEKEFPQMLDIKSSVLKYIFEPNQRGPNILPKSIDSILQSKETRSTQKVYVPKVILVTGSAGFVGSHLVNLLVKKYPSYDVIGIDKLDYCASYENMKGVLDAKNFRFIKGDLGSSDFLRLVFNTWKIDSVIHLAAQSHVDNSYQNSTIFTRDNVLATHVLLQVAKEFNVKRFIQVSTDEVYGCSNLKSSKMTEESVLNPTNPYSASKAACEMYCHSYMHSYKMPIIITRGNNIYGPHQYPEKLVPNFMLKFIRGESLQVQGSGHQIRSMMYVEDVASAFDIILHYGLDCNIYNIASPNEKTVLQIGEDIGKLFAAKPKFAFISDRPFNDQRYDLSPDKLEKLGWKERFSWEEGLQKTKEWYCNEENCSRWLNPLCHY